MDEQHSPASVALEQPASEGRTPPPLRVLVVGASWPMETFVERLFAGLSRNGIEIALLCLNSSSSRPSDEWLALHRMSWIAEPAAPVGRILAELRRHRLAALPFATRHLRGRLRGADALMVASTGGWDVVYAPWLNALTQRPELLTADPPVVTSCRGALVTVAPWDPSRADHRAALPRVFGAASLVHCVSEAIVDDAVDLGLDTGKARVIRPAVDPDIFVPGAARPGGTGPVRVVAVGTLNWRKDYETALVALRRAVDRGADVQLDLVGDGPDRQHLVFTIDDLDLGDRVRLLGRRSPAEVASLLRDADVFLHTSSSEGISNAVLEAMATALPVVTTDAGGMREAVRDGADGFVTGVRDADAIASALLQLADDPELRARMGESARQRVVDHFRLDQQVEAFAALLHEAAGR